MLNAHPEKDKNTAQVTVAKIWKKMKMDFSTANELDAEVKRQSNEWKTLSFTKKTKLHHFWSKAITKKKSSKVINEAVQKETKDSVTESDKTDKPQSSAEPCHSTTAVTPAQDKVKQKINTENEILEPCWSED